jgi:hypothetical protein
MRKLGLALTLLLASTAFASADGLTIGFQECNPGCTPITQQAITNPGVFTGTTADFSFTISGLQDNPPGVAGLLLSSDNIQTRNTTGVAGTLNVFITGQGFTSPNGPTTIESSFTQNLITGTAASMKTFIDLSNGLFTGAQIGLFDSSNGLIVPSLTNQTHIDFVSGTTITPFSLTEMYSFSANTNTQQSNATIEMLAVPGPEVGAGLPGLLSMLGGGWWCRRRRRKPTT